MHYTSWFHNRPEKAQCAKYTSEHPSSWFVEGWRRGKEDVTTTSKVPITKGMDTVDVRLPSGVGGLCFNEFTIHSEYLVAIHEYIIHFRDYIILSSYTLKQVKPVYYLKRRHLNYFGVQAPVCVTCTLQPWNQGTSLTTTYTLSGLEKFLV